MQSLNAQGWTKHRSQRQSHGVSGQCQATQSEREKRVFQGTGWKVTTVLPWLWGLASAHFQLDGWQRPSHGCCSRGRLDAGGTAHKTVTRACNLHNLTQCLTSQETKTKNWMETCPANQGPQSAWHYSFRNKRKGNYSLKTHGPQKQNIYK